MRRRGLILAFSSRLFSSSPPPLSSLLLTMSGKGAKGLSAGKGAKASTSHLQFRACAGAWRGGRGRGKSGASSRQWNALTTTRAPPPAPLLPRAHTPPPAHRWSAASSPALRRTLHTNAGHPRRRQGRPLQEGRLQVRQGRPPVPGRPCPPPAQGMRGRGRPGTCVRVSGLRGAAWCASRGRARQEMASENAALAPARSLATPFRRRVRAALPSPAPLTPT